jgi:hypothetical protein
MSVRCHGVHGSDKKGGLDATCGVGPTYHSGELYYYCVQVSLTCFMFMTLRSA